MSNKESEKKENVATSSNMVEQQSDESAAAKTIRKIPVGKPGPKCRKMVADETSEAKPTDSSGEQTNPKSSDVPGELEEMFGELASSPQKKADIPAKQTTENLLSVLEDDGGDKKTEQESLPKEPVPLPQEPAAPAPKESAAPAPKEPSTPAPTLNGSLEIKPDTPKPSSKRYVYKLKSKSGKVLRYTSNTPIVLKKPVINLTKMEEIDECGKGDNETDDIDSDNSTKENIKGNDASGDVVTQSVRKRGRPPLSQKTPVSVSLADDRNLSETVSGKNPKDKTPSSTSYGVQTRKRQLKFLPDGRLLTPSKKSKAEVETASSSGSSDVEAISDHDSDYKSSPSSSTKKFSMDRKITPVVASAEKKPVIPLKKKVFDVENYGRDKTGSEVREQSTKPQPASTPNKSGEIAKNKPISNVSNSLQQGSPSTPPTKKVTPVDPAQLLSSLIGVPITPSQLNIVKFKPKVIQERSSTGPTPKKVTIDDEKLRKMTTPSNVGGGNAPFKVVSKTTFQKILPKPSPMPPERTPIMRRVEHRIIPATATPLTYAAIAPKIGLTSDFTTPTTSTPISNNTESFSAKFDNFTDSKVVKTKGGPKKVLKRKSTGDSVGEESPKTVYELLQHVFDQMPSWNLHVIPDTNHFCIAQVSRGRMGIPILKKSIELNGEFFAKVYVHQLHCKRYDGVYDTESKILSLIREIDALAA